MCISHFKADLSTCVCFYISILFTQRKMLKHFQQLALLTVFTTLSPEAPIRPKPTFCFSNRFNYQNNNAKIKLESKKSREKIKTKQTAEE